MESIFHFNILKFHDRKILVELSFGIFFSLNVKQILYWYHFLELSSKNIGDIHWANEK